MNEVSSSATALTQRVQPDTNLVVRVGRRLLRRGVRGAWRIWAIPFTSTKEDEFLPVMVAGILGAGVGFLGGVGGSAIILRVGGAVAIWAMVPLFSRLLGFAVYSLGREVHKGISGIVREELEAIKREDR